MKILTNQKGLTLVEMLVSLLLFILASILVVTSVSHVIDKPKQASIIADLNSYQTETRLLLQEVGDSLTDQEFKDKLNMTLEGNQKFQSTGKTSALNPYGKPYDISFKKDNGQYEVTISTEGKTSSKTYSLTVIKRSELIDYCTNGFGRSNKNSTLLTSTSCTSTDEQPSSPSPPEQLVDSTDPTIRLPLEGTGTISDPYIITTLGELQGMKLCRTCTYALGNDIDATGTKAWNSGQGFEPIGEEVFSPNKTFRGNLDGRNHKIKNLYINRVGVEDSQTSLLGRQSLTSYVKNLTLDNVDITGDYWVGSVLAEGDKVTLDNVHVNGSVKGRNIVGGLIVRGNRGITGASIINSSFTGSVRGTYDVGGLFVESVNYVANSFTEGEVYSELANAGCIAVNAGDYPKIENVYSRCKVTSYSHVSGLIPTLISSDPSTFLKNSYHTGKITTNSSNVGGLTVSYPSVLTVTSSYWDKEESSMYTSGLGAGKTTSEMKQQSSYVGWDFTNVWAINPSINGGYPYLRTNPPK